MGLAMNEVDDHSMYSATVRLRSADAPEGWALLPDRVVRFGPPGWLSVGAGQGADDAFDVYPLYMVLSVDKVRELPRRAAAFSL